MTKANAYRRRILSEIDGLLRPRGTMGKTLDFGAGDGWIAEALLDRKMTGPIALVDVKKRKESPQDLIVYDGRRLPFDDRSFDLVYSIDVLHHCADPLASLADARRCAKRYFLIKDHTFGTWFGKMALATLDEIGNRRFGIPSPYNYQKDWDWFKPIENDGFVLEKLIHPALCHTGLLGWATNSLQFIALWKRGEVK